MEKPIYGMEPKLRMSPILVSGHSGSKQSGICSPWLGFSYRSLGQRSHQSRLTLLYVIQSYLHYKEKHSE